MGQAWRLFPRHTVPTWPLHLLPFLDQRAAMAEKHGEKVSASPALYVPALTDFPTDADVRHKVQDRHEVGETAEDARLPDSLSVLPHRVAWHEVGDNADAEVVKATEETVLEF